MKGIYQGVLGVGALAGAVAAILAIRVPHDVEDAAEFKTISVIPSVPFNEYEQHLVAPHPQLQGLRHIGMPVLSLVADISPAPEPEATPTPADTTPTAVDHENSSDGASSDGANSEGANGNFDSGKSAAGFDSGPGNVSIFKQAGPRTPNAPAIVRLTPVPSQAPAEVHAYRIEVQNACEKRLVDQTCQSILALTQTPTDSNGKPITSAAAAKRQITLLKALRTTRVKGTRKRQPVGVVVVANMDLSGLRGKSILLSWSMWRQGGGQRLYGDWLNESLAYRMKATSDHDTASVDFWIPLPKSRGPFFIQSRLAIGDSTLATADTRSFD
jgi:hypothetical protein